MDFVPGSITNSLYDFGQIILFSTLSVFLSMEKKKERIKETLCFSNFREINALKIMCES